jgi:glycosyltransferase involved in cell wall biosynthesis
MSNPKILIACPTYDGMSYCLDEFLDAIRNLNYDNYDVLIVDNSESEEYYNQLRGLGLNAIKDYFSTIKDSPMKRLVNSRNIILEHTIKGDYDYLLTIDSDVILPKDAIERLLKHDKDIVSGVYYKISEQCGFRQEYPLLMTACDEKGNPITTDEPNCQVRYFTNNEIKDKGLIKADAIGLGCALISKEVIERFRFKHESSKDPTDDMFFSIEMKRLGYQIYADTGLICRHLIDGKKEIVWQ